MRHAAFVLALVLASCSDEDTTAGPGGAGGAGGATGGTSGAGGSAAGSGGGSGGSGSCEKLAPSLERLGATFDVPTLDSSVPKRNPDVAHDPTNDVYLVVTGTEVISGTFLDADGQSLAAPFPIAQTTAYTQTPRVIHGGGKFLVAWHDNRGSVAPEVRARLLSFDGAAPDLSAADFSVSQGGQSYQEMGTALAYSETSDTFLVVWHALPDNDMRARRIDRAGAVLGDEIAITADADWQSGAAAAWSSTRDEFLVSWTHAGSTEAAVRARRIRAADGSLSGSELELGTAAGTWTTQLAYSACDDRYLLGWIADGAVGRALGGDGAPLASPFSFPAGYGYPEGFAIAAHPALGTLAAVMHGPTDEDFGCAFSDSGEQSEMIAVTDNAGSAGHFNPRIVANRSRSEWLLVTSHGFTSIVAQRLVP